MDRVFSDFFENCGVEAPFRTNGTRAYPALNIWDEGEVIVAEAEVPGLKMEDLEVFVCNEGLTIQGKWREVAGENTAYQHRERGFGEFSRAVRLPVAVDPDKTEASLKNGVLTVRLAKAQGVLPRKVNVQG